MELSNADRIKQLVTLLNKARYTYEQEDREIMSNRTYDALYDELLKLESSTGIVLSNSPTQNVGYEVVSKLPKEQHEYPALSLDKTKDRNKLVEWLWNKVGHLSWKDDGLTIVSTFIDGSLIKTVTRGNGYVGEVITNNSFHFIGLPNKISYKGKLIVRSEAMISYDEFNRINNTIEDIDSKFKNPRNLASGTVRSLDSSLLSQRHIEINAFELVYCDKQFATKHETFDFLKDNAFECVEYKLVTKDNLLETIQWYENTINDNKLPSDGLVLAYDDINYGKSLGMTGKFPRNAIAFKWKDDVVSTTLRDIEWSTSRTGLINPVAIFDSCEIEGTTVSRATLHNVSIIEDLQLGIGDEITVYKSNKIIPKIDDNFTRSNTYKLPTKCPDCGGDVEIHNDNGSKTLHCTNSNCPAKLLDNLTHFVSRNCMNIDGLSESTLDKFIKLGWLHNYVDIYNLKEHKQEMYKLDGFGKKSVDNLLQSIENSKTVKLDAFINSLGIKGIGKEQAKTIAKYVNYDIDDFTRCINNYFDFSELDGIGEVLSKSIEDWFADDANSIDISIKLEDMFTFVKDEQKQSSNTTVDLSNKIFVITGSVNHYTNREELKTEIESLGGKVSGSVSAKTSYLINNDITSTSGKNAKAKQLNVPIISEEDYMKLIGKEF